MKSFLSRLFSRSKKDISSVSKAEFDARFYRFRLFIGAYIEAYGEIMNFEERANDAYPVGMPFLRTSTARLSVATMQCLLQLNALSHSTHRNLETAFDDVRKSVQGILSQGVTPLEGPLVLSYSELDKKYASLVAPSLIPLGTISRELPEYVPIGFVMTGAAWWQYYDNVELHDELDRIICISQEDPSSYNEAGASSRECLLANFPLPEILIASVTKALEPLRAELEKPGTALLLRCTAVRPEHSALVMPEQIISASNDNTIFQGLLAALAQSYRPRAMIYRTKLGIRDRSMPFCFSLSVVPEVHSRGSAHSGLGKNSTDIVLHIRRSMGTGAGNPSSQGGAFGKLPEDIRQRVEAACIDTLRCLGDEPTTEKRFEVFWVVDTKGNCSILGVTVLVEPAHALLEADTVCGRYTGDVVEGGLSTYPGYAQGKVSHVRNLEDALFFPIGSILNVQTASPRWSFLLDFARGAIAGDGSGNGLFARTARRFGRPTILGTPEAVEKFPSYSSICIAARPDRPVVYACSEEECNEDISDAQKGRAAIGHNTATGDLWLHTSDLATMVKNLAPHLLFISLPDSDDPEYLARNCKSFHDILIYMYGEAMQEMVSFSTSRKAAAAPAKQLVCEVPKQFWVINLADGFSEEIKGSTVRLDQIVSTPMQSFWEGFSSKPWDGPPQINARGLLSVMYEATMNPELDSTSQSSRYTAKNIFLIAQRFCSLKCRFGFHFLSLECLLGDRDRERFIIFQFKGGAANIQRRIRRVHFVADLLSHFGFTTEITSDRLAARFEQGDIPSFLAALRVVGYLFMHTRQLDMIMGDEDALAARRKQMLNDMAEVAKQRS